MSLNATEIMSEPNHSQGPSLARIAILENQNRDYASRIAALEALIRRSKRAELILCGILEGGIAGNPSGDDLTALSEAYRPLCDRIVELESWRDTIIMIIEQLARHVGVRVEINETTDERHTEN